VNGGSGAKDLPTIYIITPTYKRPEQIPDLTRLSQTLMHVPAIHWLLIEDAETLNPHVADIAKRSRVPFTHLIGMSAQGRAQNHSIAFRLRTAK